MMNNPQQLENPEDFQGLNLKDFLSRDGWVSIPEDQVLVPEDQKLDSENLPEGMEKAYYYSREDGTTLVVYDPSKVKIHTERGDNLDSVNRINVLRASGATQILYTDLFVEKIEKQQ